MERQYTELKEAIQKSGNNLTSVHFDGDEWTYSFEGSNDIWSKSEFEVGSITRTAMDKFEESLSPSYLWG